MTEHDWLEFVFQNLPPLEVEDNKIKQTKEGKERVGFHSSLLRKNMFAADFSFTKLEYLLL